MPNLRKLLFPFSIVYNGVTQSRNVLYNQGILKENEFDLPVIVVGNLRVGGTGKTPMIAYLVNLLHEKYTIAVLSRGYKRTTTGFVIADEKANAQTLGDESYQLYRCFPRMIVAVDTDRVNGINQLLSLPKPPQVILLDDAFQHRSVKAGLNILLTPYNDLYVEDALLPAGNLRENVSGAERAQIIVVTKSPEKLSETEEFETVKKLKPQLTQTVFFSTIVYHQKIIGKHYEIPINQLHEYQVLLFTGIANPQPLLQFLHQKNVNYEHIMYPDHYAFKNADIQNIKNKFNKITQNKKLILTTEKDYVRIFDALDDLYYLPIQTQFVNHQDSFNQMIFNYVEQSTRNRTIS